jgi:hypothetical protein
VEEEEEEQEEEFFLFLFFLLYFFRLQASGEAIDCGEAVSVAC